MGTIQEYKPVAASTLSDIVYQLKPLSTENSILTFEIPGDVQVMFCVVPAVQFSPPLGDETVNIAGVDIANDASIMSVTLELAVSDILTRQFVESLFGTVQE